MTQEGFVESSDGTRIAYSRYGSGPTVILVNGALGYRGHRGMAELAAALAGHFSVIDYDRRGRGESGNTEPYHVDREIEDIGALIGAEGNAYVYGFSSGAGLALLAAAQLGGRVVGLAMMEPPYGEDSAEGRQEHAEFSAALKKFADSGERAQALELFLGGMVPPEMLAKIKQSPDWPLMEAVSDTLYYDCEVLGDGAVPAAVAATIDVPTLVLTGSESPDFKHAAAHALATAIPGATAKNIEGQDTMAPAAVLAPILKDFWSR